MICVTTLNNVDFYINCDYFEKIEATPDTVITMTNGKKYVVKTSPEEIINRIIEFRRNYYCRMPEVNKIEEE
jgi:flagellar protein FlbD